MNIDPNGRPISSHTFREVRDLFLRSGDEVHVARIAMLLALPLKSAKAVVGELVAAGYLTVHKRERGVFETTAAARRLANAKFIKRMTRAQADALLAGLLQRANELNEQPDLTDYVEEIHVFGSYLDDRDDLGDLDIAVKLSRREADGKLYVAQNLARAKASGKQMQYFEQLYYGEAEVRRLLRARKGRISLHTVEDMRGLGTQSRLVYSRNSEV